MLLNIPFQLNKIISRLDTLIEHPSQHFPNAHNIGISFLDLRNGRLDCMLFVCETLFETG